MSVHAVQLCHIWLLIGNARSMSQEFPVQLKLTRNMVRLTTLPNMVWLRGALLLRKGVSVQEHQKEYLSAFRSAEASTTVEMTVSDLLDPKVGDKVSVDDFSSRWISPHWRS